MSNPRQLIWEGYFPLICLKGLGTRRFLQGQISSEILSINNTQIIKSCWLSPVARLRALLEVRAIDDEAQILVLSGKVQDVFNGLERVIFPFDQVTIKWGPEIRRLQIMSFDKPWQETSFEWISNGSLEEETYDKYQISTKKEFEEWRIKQGIPLGTHELNGEINPFELGLSSLIDLTKGCFLGQETLSKLSNKGLLKQELRMISSNEDLSPGDKLFFKDKNIDKLDYAGYITSSIEKSSKNNIGLAVIRRKFLKEKILIHKDLPNLVKINNTIGFN